MKGYNEIREYLEGKYKRYFEILNIDLIVREFMFHNFEKEIKENKIKEELNACLDNYIDCLKISSTIPDRLGGKDDFIYKYYLKLANEIKKEYEDVLYRTSSNK